MEALTFSTVRIEGPEALGNEILFLLAVERRKSVDLYVYKERDEVHISKVPRQGIRRIKYESGGKPS